MKNQLFDKNIAVVISVIALIVSVASLYFTSLKPANIILSVGDRFRVAHKNHYLYIFLPIIISNTGAQPGVIRSIGVILKDQKSEDTIFLKWQAFANLQYGPKGFEWIDESSDTATSVPARSELTQMATFSGGGSVASRIPKPSTYDMYLLAWTSESEMPSIIPIKSTWIFYENAVSEIKWNFEENNAENTYIILPAYGPDSKMLSSSDFKMLINK
jgi:hypothetical protein